MLPPVSTNGLGDTFPLISRPGDVARECLCHEKEKQAGIDGQGGSGPQMGPSPEGHG